MLMRNKINLNYIKKQIKSKKGFALLGTLILVFVVSTFGIALLTMTQNDIKLSTLQKASKETFYIAESGIEHAISYLESMGTPNFASPTNPFLTAENGGYLDMGNGKYKVTIESATTFSYIIQSTGERSWTNTSGKISKTIESKVILENFAMYAYFSDSELFPPDIDAGYGGQPIWFNGNDHISGPLHSNDRLHMSGTPTFDGSVTSHWVNPTDPLDVSWDAYDSQTSPNFLGTPPYKGGVDRIELPQFRQITDPTDPKSLQRIAAGSEDFINNNGNGAYVPNDGSNVTDGIWVKGKVENLILGTDPQGNSQIIVEQTGGDNKTTIITTVKTPVTIDSTTYPSGTTLVDVYKGTNHTYSNYNGFTNGVLFVNGEVKNLQSTAGDGGVKGKLTIASDSTITIGDNILYKTKVDNPNCFDVPVGTYPVIPDSLGLVSEGNIMIKKTTTSNDMEIDAIIMALGTSFYYEGWNNTLKGNLTVHGSFIQKQRGPIGQFNSGGKVHGYTKNYNFDTRMSINNPGLGQALPPYFPTTGKYIKLYWKEVD
jgi:Tfp pilus assembly protein PilX